MFFLQFALKFLPEIVSVFLIKMPKIFIVFLQIEQRACTVHGSLARVKEKLDERETRRREASTKKREKQLKGGYLF
jgi:hypothetical protein